MRMIAFWVILMLMTAQGKVIDLTYSTAERNGLDQVKTGMRAYGLENVTTSDFSRIPTLVVSVEAQVRNDSSYQVRVVDLVRWNIENGMAPEKALVIVRTGWSKFLTTRPQKYFGTSRKTWPSLSYDAIEWMILEWNPRGIAIDGPSLMSQRKMFRVQDFTLLTITNLCPAVSRLDSIAGRAFIEPIRPRTGTNYSPVKISIHTGLT